MEISRRKFLGASAAAVIVAGTRSAGKVFGANDRIRIACIGIRGRGGSHISAFTENEGSEVIALCDVDKNVLAERAKQVQEKTGKQPVTAVDMRDIFANDSVDAVSIATPNHWHSLATIWACQAGKDVYVEKPISHNIFEGRQVVEAARQNKRIVQHGTQRRSEANWMRDMKLLRDGFIGKVYMARALCFKWRDSIGAGKPAAPPAHLDYNLWLGPSQWTDYLQREDGSGLFVHYDWHWFWAWGNGDIGNQGVHQMDVAVWGLNKGLPVEVSSTGGRYTYEDMGETPNTQVATMKYADGSLLVFEVRGRATNDEGGVKVGNLFYGSEGYYVEGQGFLNMKGEPIPVEQEAPPSDGCFGNFLKAVRSRNEADIQGNALEAHISSAHCHLANIAYRTGQTLTFNPAKERFEGCRKANKLLTRDYRDEFKVPKLT